MYVILCPDLCLYKNVLSWPSYFAKNILFGSQPWCERSESGLFLDSNLQSLKLLFTDALISVHRWSHFCNRQRERENVTTHCHTEFHFTNTVGDKRANIETLPEAGEVKPEQIFFWFHLSSKSLLIPTVQIHIMGLICYNMPTVPEESGD